MIINNYNSNLIDKSYSNKCNENVDFIKTIIDKVYYNNDKVNDDIDIINACENNINNVVNYDDTDESNKNVNGRIEYCIDNCKGGGLTSDPHPC